jgi:N-dimethylarginine dimethylaminohydrolase
VARFEPLWLTFGTQEGQTKMNQYSSSRAGTAGSASVIEREKDWLDYRNSRNQWDETAFSPNPDKVLFVDPASFRIETAINVHMQDANGKPHSVNHARAQQQWNALVDAYRKLVPHVYILQPECNFPDIVFCANQTFPFIDPKTGKKSALMSEMHSPTRKPEVPFFAAFLQEHGYQCQSQTNESPLDLEGMGDLIAVPPITDRPGFICAGHGQRTDRRVLPWVAERTGQTVVAFELLNKKFYHLDTCLSVLNARTALACREGFTESGWRLLETLFPNLIVADITECDAPGFAANCHSPDGKSVVIQKGNSLTKRALSGAGFEVIEVETDEFIKAGGSVFCMKLMFF